MLKHLNPREERIIRMRFGFEDGNPRTLEEVGETFDVTREHIRQIEARCCANCDTPRVPACCAGFTKVLCEAAPMNSLYPHQKNSKGGIV
jgi:hypothetical protein